MFTIGNLPDLDTVIDILREAKPRINIIFPNECPDSPIVKFSICKFNKLYIIELHLKEDANLSDLGFRKPYGRFDAFPDITYLSYTQPVFQKSVSIEHGDMRNLTQVFAVAEALDSIDPKFIAYINQLINIEIEYRKNIKIDNRFEDLIPDTSACTEEFKKSRPSLFQPVRFQIAQDAVDTKHQRKAF
jgi:hypothetical protein